MTPREIRNKASRNWQKRNRDKLNAKRRQRYASDPDYRARRAKSHAKWLASMDTADDTQKPVSSHPGAIAPVTESYVDYEQETVHQSPDIL